MLTLDGVYNDILVIHLCCTVYNFKIVLEIISFNFLTHFIYKYFSKEK